MPRIPGVEQQISSLEAPAGPRLGPSEFGASAAAALERFGSTIEDTTARLDSIYQETKANQASTAATQELQDYAYQLKNGPTDPATGKPKIDPATGLPEAPPEPTKHAELFQQKVDEVRQRMSNQLSGNGAAIRKFNDEFSNFANRATLDVKSHAMNYLHQTIRANTQLDLQHRATASIAASDIERPEIIATTFDDIDRLVTSKILTPEEGFTEKERFATEVNVGHIRNIIKRGPNGPSDVIAAIDRGEFKELRPDVQERWRDIAIKQQETNDRRSLMDLQREDLEEQRAQKKAGDAAMKNGIDLINSNEITPEWLAAHKGALSPSQYESLANSLAKDKRPSDTGVVDSFVARVARGEDISDDLDRAHDIEETVNSADYRMLYGKVQHSQEFKDQQWAVAGQREIHKSLASIGGFGIPVQGRGIADSDALEAWNGWVRAHRKDNNGAGPSPEAIQSAKDAIIRGAAREARIATPDRILPTPRFAPGGRNALYNDETGPDTLAETKRITVKKWHDKEISREEYEREAIKLKKWSSHYPLRAKPVGK